MWCRDAYDGGRVQTHVLETAKESQQKQRTQRQVTLRDYVQLARAKLGREEATNKGNQPGNEQGSGPPEKGSTKGRRGAPDNECPKDSKGTEPEGKQEAIPKRGARKQKGKGMDDGADKKEGAGQEPANPDLVRAATINITAMATSQAILLEREEDLIFFQEHSTPGNKVATIQALAAESGWRMDLGPVDESTDRISAGVGAMWNPGRVKIHIAALSTTEGRDFENIGRLRKYIVQFVHGNPFMVYNIYAWVSGAKDKMANRRTNLMMEEIRKDARMIKNQPYLITGDLNGLPQDFDVLGKMCAQGDLHDVGALETVAGADNDGPTCCTAAQEEGNRRDFVLASYNGPPFSGEPEHRQGGHFPNPQAGHDGAEDEHPEERSQDEVAST